MKNESMILLTGATGFLGSRFLRQIINGLSTAGSAMEVVIIVAVMAYIAYRAWIYYKHRIYRVVPRIQVEELALRLSEESLPKRIERSRNAVSLTPVVARLSVG